MDTEALISHRRSIAVAESLTGGMLASRLVDIPGISAVFRGGVVAYHPDVKRDVLGVDQFLIDTYTVVSAPVAVAMARGVAHRCDAELAVATTGVAGPGNDGEHVAGTVWIGTNAGRAWKFIFPGDRDHVRILATEAAMSILENSLEIAEKSPFLVESWENPEL